MHTTGGWPTATEHSWKSSSTTTPLGAPYPVRSRRGGATAMPQRSGGPATPGASRVLPPAGPGYVSPILVRRHRPGCAEMVTGNPARCWLDGHLSLDVHVSSRSVCEVREPGPPIRRSRAPPLGVVAPRQARVLCLPAAREAPVMAARLLIFVYEVTFADALAARLRQPAAGSGSLHSLLRPEPR